MAANNRATNQQTGNGKQYDNRRKQLTIAKRIAQQKTDVLVALEKIPVVQIACQRAGVSKATYYRWRQNDLEFMELADIARQEGMTTICELAKSKLIEQINDGNLTAAIFWLKSRDPEFTERKHIVNELKDAKHLAKNEAEIIDSTFTMFERVARRAEEHYNPETKRFEEPDGVIVPD